MIKKAESTFPRAMADITSGCLNYKLWAMLGWLDIKQRYRRSLLGPLWLTISTGVFVMAMGPLYGKLFNQSTADYVPYVAASMIAWQLISGVVTDSCQVFIAAEGYVKHTRLPLSLYVYRVSWRNVLIFAHNLIILIVVGLFMPLAINAWTLLAVAGVLLIAINSVWMGLLFGMMCARFRDLPQIIGSVLQIAFFITPIFWKPEMLGHRTWVSEVNPLFHLIEVVRSPLLGKSASLLSWGVVTGLTIIGSIGTLLIFSRYRARIAYWI